LTNADKPTSTASVVAAALVRTAASPWGTGVAIAIILFAVVLNSLQRTHFNMDVETDFTGGFGPDAIRVLNGEPLKLPYHPPGYPFAVALARVLSGSWLAGGLWLSGISALIVVVIGFVTVRRLFGVAASWGVLAACACSTTFLAFASTVSSDMLFAAIATILLAFVVGAMLEPRRIGVWFFAGMAAACVMLMRANGFAAAAALLTPLLVSASFGNRLRWLGVMVLGLAVPLLLWVLYATVTDSPLAAQGNYLNLAVAAYGDETKSWAEQSPIFAAQFTGLIDVLTHDPARMAAQLSKRLVLFPVQLMLKLTWPPLAVLAVPGLLWVLFRNRTPVFLVYLLIACALALLAAIAEFRPRYFLFLLPLIGGLGFLALNEALRRFVQSDQLRAVAYVLAICIVGLVAARANAPVMSKVEPSGLLETAEATPQVRRLTEPNAVIFARKSNLAFGAGRLPWQFRDVADLDELREDLCADIVPGQPAYLFIGSAEREERARVANDLSASKHVAWLQLVAKGEKTEWSLYRILLEESDGCA
jgi:Dolichyl-phosphate-mannose-protein mannosyltransferase